jgi:hypothetical protein
MCRGVPCKRSERNRPRRIEVTFRLARPVQKSPFVDLIKADIGGIRPVKAPHHSGKNVFGKPFALTNSLRL